MLRSAETKALLRKCDEVSRMLKSLAHPVRLKVLCRVIEGEKSVGELREFCGISQSAMSQFLGRMRDEGLIKSRRGGSFVYYGIADQSLARLLRAIKEIYC